MEETIQLLDSIAKCYPIGSFILWETHEYLKYLRNIGDLQLDDVPEGRLVSYILDGQQRITSLYACIKNAVIKNKPYTIYFDTDKSLQENDLFNGECTDPTRFVEVTEILGDNPQRIYDTLNPQRKKNFNQLRDSFKFYNFPVMKVKEATLDVVCDIFERVNNSGQELTVFDLMVAKTWSPDFDLREKYDDLQSELDSINFGGIKPSIIVEAVSAILKRSIRREEILSITRDEMKDNWDAIINAFKLAVDFIRMVIKVPASKILPYDVIIVPLSYFFYNRQNPTGHQVTLLKRFFWRSSLSMRYSHSVDSQVAQDFTTMDGILKNRLIKIIPVNITQEMIEQTPMSLGNAFCKTILCFLASNDPLCPKTGGKVIIDNSHLSKSNSRHYHHFFPTNYLKKKNMKELANLVANIIFIPSNVNLAIRDKEPLQYLTELENNHNSNIRGTLTSHYIYDWNDFGINSNDYMKFIKQRSKIIFQELQKTI